MDNIKKKKKTRAQKRFLKVGIVTSIFTILFTVGTVISAIFLPKQTDLDSLTSSDYISNVYKGEDESFYVTAITKSSGTSTNGYIYHFDKNEQMIEKVDIFKSAKDKFGITGLNRLNCFIPSYDLGIAYIGSDNYVFALSGIDTNNIEVTGYTNDFIGEVKNIAFDEDDLYVASKEGASICLSRYEVGDDTFSLKARGHLYETDFDDDTGEYLLSTYAFTSINKMVAREDNVYIFTKNETFIYNKDLSGCNYRFLYEKELKATKEKYPEKTAGEISSIALSSCKEKYHWTDYDYGMDEVSINEKYFPIGKSYYLTAEDKVGIAIYLDRIVMFGRDQYCYTMNFSDFEDIEPIESLDNILTIHRDISSPYQLAKSDNVLSFYDVGIKAIVRYYDTTSNVSVFNLRDLKFEYTVEVASNISEAFLNNETDYMYFKYTDKVNKSADRNYFSKVYVPLQLKAGMIRGLLIASIVLLVITATATIVCFVGYGFKKGAFAILKTGQGIKKHWPIYVIIIPSFVLLCLFCYYPGISAIFTSFFDYKPAISEVKTWNNFANYAQIFGNAESLRHFGNMIIFLVIDIVIATIPPLIFAFFLSLVKAKKFSGVLRTLLFIPGIIPGVAGVLIWKDCIYGSYGLINTLITASGGTKIANFFPKDSYLSIISLVMMGFPFVGSYLIFYGCMMNIPSSYYEAAEIDGITVWKRFIKIDIPLCLPQLKYVFIMTIIASIQNFSRIWIGMGGLPGIINTPITKMYDLMYNEKDYGLASAYATVLFVILFGLTFISMRKKTKARG